MLAKDPDSVISYTLDWSDWLDTDTIATSTWASTPTGLTEDAESETTTTTTIKLSGGTAGTVYRVTNDIVTTTGAESPQRSIVLTVEER